MESVSKTERVSKFDADDRTDAERTTHTVGVAMTDRCLSGWGGAEGGVSVACWACRDEHLNDVESWVRSRSDAKRVRIVDLRTWRPKAAHVHVYVANPGHPSIQRIGGAS